MVDRNTLVDEISVVGENSAVDENSVADRNTVLNLEELDDRAGVDESVFYPNSKLERGGKERESFQSLPKYE